MLFIVTIHSDSFLPYLSNLNQRLTELNVCHFYLTKLIFFKNIPWRKLQVNVKGIKLSFIQQVCLQFFFIKQDNV